MADAMNEPRDGTRARAIELAKHRHVAAEGFPTDGGPTPTWDELPETDRARWIQQAAGYLWSLEALGYRLERTVAVPPPSGAAEAVDGAPRLTADKVTAALARLRGLGVPLQIDLPADIAVGVAEFRGRVDTAEQISAELERRSAEEEAKAENEWAAALLEAAEIARSFARPEGEQSPRRTGLRDRIAAAIAAEHRRRAAGGVQASPEDHAAAFADAVLRDVPSVVRNQRPLMLCDGGEMVEVHDLSAWLTAGRDRPTDRPIPGPAGTPEHLTARFLTRQAPLATDTCEHCGMAVVYNLAIGLMRHEALHADAACDRPWPKVDGDR